MTGKPISRKDDVINGLLTAARVVPVLTIERVEDGAPLARALVAGGVRTLEITLRTDAAIAAARAVISEVPDAIVGIGTVLTPDDLAQVKSLGGRFAVSPGATPELLDAAAQSDLPFLPGIATASDLMQAQARGPSPSSTKLEPRFCQRMPEFSSTQPEPNSK
jgi:2-dehydro-3-deoxyphosphogluconate aldolase/(4S)-4-hydroxy-2-oxoglutarate aldolase